MKGTFFCIFIGDIDVKSWVLKIPLELYTFLFRDMEVTNMEVTNMEVSNI